MSDTTEAAVRRLRESSPTVDAVCRQLERQVDPDEADLVAHFAEILFSKAPPEFLHERSTDALAHMALGAFRFLGRSSGGGVDVEVLNPDVDNEGWYAPVTVIRTDLSERPFIVDTIREYLHAQDVAIEHLIYPVMHVQRDETGSVIHVRPSREGGQRESLVHCEVSRVTDAAVLEGIRADLTRLLQDVVRATDDFEHMVDALDSVMGDLAQRATEVPALADELEEIQAFLRWLRDGGFVFLGYRGYDLVPVAGREGRSIVVEPGSGLGILRNEAESTYAEAVPL
ncbi:MAG TPA: hypothetical protein VE173_05210, partial [Longimicrobiales bacterium]|nr:hypothetical protein [Longimicrobiales bacterium]